MVKEVYRVLNFLLLCLVALFAIAVQSVVLRSSILGWLELDLLLVLVTYVAIHRPLWEGALLVLVVSRLAETHSGSPAGMLSFCYIAVCFTIYFTKSTFLFGTPFATVLLGILAGLLFKLTYFILCFYTGFADNLHWSALQYLLSYLLGLALVVRPLFHFGEWLDLKTNYRELSEARRLAGEDF